MKTQIIQLEPHDDAISTRDKMGWSQTGRVLLVWPRGKRVLARQLDLVLLQRHSQALGAQLALVTNDSLVRYSASLLGLPVFENVRQAQDARWRRPRRKARRKRSDRGAQSLLTPPANEGGEAPQPTGSRLFYPIRRPATLPHPALRYGFFAVGILAFFTLVAMLLPSAEISLTPASEWQELELPVQASASVERVNLSGVVPIRSIHASVEGRAELTPTGTIQVPERRATGRVRFTNLTDQVVFVPAGSVVGTRGALVRFATDHTSQVPAGAGRYIDIPVTALTPGSAGNLPADRIQAILSPLGVSLAVSNPTPTTGGSDRPSPAPTPLDRSRLRGRLLLDLQESAQAEMRANLGPDDLLLTPTPTLLNTLEETYNPPDQQPANQLSLLLRLDYQGQMISGEDLRALATTLLDAVLPSGFSALPDTLEIQHLDRPVLGEGATVRWNMRIRRKIIAKLESGRAVAMTMGRSPNLASQQLTAGLPLAAPPKIFVSPRWWPRMPILPFRIVIHSE